MLLYSRFFGLLFFCFALAFSCNPKKHEHSFYFWKSNFELSSLEKTVLKENQINKIYLRFFDIVFDKESKIVKPVAVIKIKDSLILQTIPVIYIENAAFTNTEISQIKDLTSNALKLIHSLSENNNIKYNELQFDCDWTESTQEKYFTFLNEVKKAEPQTKLSATIRLHQLKYKEQTGIPPVNAAVIMLYNMGELASFEEENSILNIEKAGLYINHLKNYELPYELALPIFSWSVVFRNHKIIHLNKDILDEDLNDTANFSKVSPCRYQCKKSFSSW